MRFWATRDENGKNVYLWRTKPERINGLWMRGESWPAFPKMSPVAFTEIFGGSVAPGERVAVTLEKVTIERRM